METLANNQLTYRDTIMKASNRRNGGDGISIGKTRTQKSEALRRMGMGTRHQQFNELENIFDNVVHRIITHRRVHSFLDVGAEVAFRGRRGATTVDAAIVAPPPAPPAPLAAPVVVVVPTLISTLARDDGQYGIGGRRRHWKDFL